MKMKEITVKLIALALCGCITCSFAACGDSADSGTTDSKKSSSVSTEQSQSETKNETKEDETSSTAEENDYRNGVVSIDVHYKFSNHFDDDWKLYGDMNPITSKEDNSCFLSIPKLCNEYNNLTIDSDKPGEWLDTVKDELAQKLNNGVIYTVLNPELNITNQEVQEINGRKFVRFEGTFYNDGSSKDVAFVCYLTVVKGDPNLSEYVTDNTAGFMVAQDADKADIETLDSYARIPAETMTVGEE